MFFETIAGLRERALAAAGFRSIALAPVLGPGSWARAAPKTASPAAAKNAVAADGHWRGMRRLAVMGGPGVPIKRQTHHEAGATSETGSPCWGQSTGWAWLMSVVSGQWSVVSGQLLNTYLRRARAR